MTDAAKDESSVVQPHHPSQPAPPPPAPQAASANDGGDFVLPTLSRRQEAMMDDEDG